MSTGPEPTRNAGGTTDPSVDDLAERDRDQSSSSHAGGATNLAYEDMLAKLELSAKAPESESEMSTFRGSSTLSEANDEDITPPLTPHMLPYPASVLATTPAEEITVRAEKPLPAEEQEATHREGRMAPWRQPSVHDDLRSAPTEPLVPFPRTAKSKLPYLMLGGLLVLGGMLLAVLVLKLLMPPSAPQPPAVVAPAPPPTLSLPVAPSAHIEPLPPSAPAAVAPAEKAPKHTAGKNAGRKGKYIDPFEN